MSQQQDPPIVVSGGSVSLTFDTATLPGSSGNHSNAAKKIKHIKVESNGSVLIDEDIPNGRAKVTIIYGNP